MASPKQSSSKLPTIALPELPNLMNHLPSSLNNFAIPLIPAPPNNRFNEDPQAYAKEMKTKKGAPLSGQKDLLPASIVNRQKGNVDLMDAPARAAMNMPNGNTSHKQARALRHLGNRPEDVMTPEFELTEDSRVIGLHQSPEVNGHSNLPSFAVSSDMGVEKDYLPSTDETGSGDGYFGRGIAAATSALDPFPWTSSRAPSRSPSPSGWRDNTLLRRVFIDRSASPTQHLLRPTFPPPSLSTYSPTSPRALTLMERIKLNAMQSVSLLVSTVFLSGVVIWAVSMSAYTQIPRLLKGQPKRRTFPWDDEKYWAKNEKVSRHPRDYARAIGMDIEDQTIETEDGYYLKVHRIIDPDARKHSDGKGGYPVLILHGLFQSSGSFITSEDRSMAFWLAKQGGYQVYLGNGRGVFGMGHRNFKRGDPRFWDWTIRELAMYDLPAMVNHVLAQTGYTKLAFIGHSQGNGLAFISLSLGMCPDLGKRMSCFVALAPAVYAGPLTQGFPFNQLGKIEWTTWKRLFGVLDFIPLMRIAADSPLIPPKVFASLGYIMFAYLFSWTDTAWLHRRKIKMFRFTPSPVSSASVFWWCGKGGFADRKCTLDDSLDRWYDDRFPPLSIYYGGKDYLVLTEPLLERLEKKEKIKPIRVEKLADHEHCDMMWHMEAVELVFGSLRQTIEETRLRYPEEIENDQQ